MKSQTQEQNAVSSIEIERLLRNELKDTISFWTKKFANTFTRRLGITRADLMNDMREQIWKGLLTYDRSKGANVKTYMNHIIENRFKTLADRCNTPKFKNMAYFADVYASTGTEHLMVTEDTPETVFEQREELMIRLASLNQFESDRVVLMHLAMGHGLDDMEEATGLTRPVIVGAIKRIDIMLREQRSKQDE
jgi:DNA-directed RNA polymerase specialized sigma24 family protein